MRPVKDELITVFILFLIFHAIFELITKSIFVHHLQEAVVNVMTAKPELFASLDQRVKEDYVRTSIVNTAGEDFGTAVVEEIVLPYMGDTIPLRRDFKYNIEAMENHPLRPDSIDAAYCREVATRLSDGCSDNLWLEQSCEYKIEHRDKTKVPEKRFKAAIVFDKSSLRRRLNDHAMFYRDIIEFDENIKSVIMKFSAADAEDFVRKILGFAFHEIADEDVGIKYDVSLVENPDGMPYILMTTTRDVEGRGVRLSYRSPHAREAPWFVTSLPQPCINPVITFRRNDRMTRLEAIPFLSNFKDSKIQIETAPDQHDPRRYTVSVRGWTFPTAGIMFTWRYRQDDPNAPAPKQLVRPPSLSA